MGYFGGSNVVARSWFAISIVSTTAGICFIAGKSVDRLTLGELKSHARNDGSNAFRSNPRIRPSLLPENEKLDVRKYFDNPINRSHTNHCDHLTGYIPIYR
jgi:hypothetical protein